jgi:hypothetical protein
VESSSGKVLHWQLPSQGLAARAVANGTSPGSKLRTTSRKEQQDAQQATPVLLPDSVLHAGAVPSILQQVHYAISCTCFCWKVEQLNRVYHQLHGSLHKLWAPSCHILALKLATSAYWHRLTAPETLSCRFSPSSIVLVPSSCAQLGNTCHSWFVAVVASRSADLHSHYWDDTARHALCSVSKCLLSD